MQEPPTHATPSPATANRSRVRLFAPPDRDGVGASTVHTTPGPWANLLEFLTERLRGVSRAEWQRRLEGGLVLDETGQPLAADTPYQVGRKLHYYRHVPDEPCVAGDVEVLFQDENLVVADKPHGMTVTPSGPYLQQTLLVRLKRQLGLEHLAPVHRIDRDTAGLVLFVVQPQARDAYHALFRERSVHKVYEALAAVPSTGLTFPHRHCSRMAEDPEAFFRMCEVPGVPNSETLVEVAGVYKNVARYRLLPVTGRQHQLRVHMNALGLPIAGDPLYPQVRTASGETGDSRLPLQLLARSIAFTDPVTGRAHHFESVRQLDFAAAQQWVSGHPDRD